MIENDLVLLFNLVTRMSESLGQVAVVSEQEETFRLGVESSDIKQARQMGRQKIENGVARIRIAPGRNETGRFMQHDVEPALTVDEFAPDLDMIAFRGLRAEVGANPAVDRHAARGNQFIAMAPRTQPGGGEKTVQAHG